METGPSEYASEHASAVAREVVRVGLAPMETVRKSFQEYTELLKLHGPRGTFTQLLLVRGVIDRSGFDRIQAAVPPDAVRLQSATGASQVFRLAPGAIAAAAPSSSSQVAALPRTPAPPPPAVPGALPPGRPPDIDRLGGSTMVFQGVIAPPPGLFDSDDEPPAPASSSAPAPGAAFSLDAIVGDGLGSSDELALPPPPPRPTSDRVATPPSRPPSSRTPPPSLTPPSSRTPDPVGLDATTVPSSDVLDLPLSLADEVPPPGARVRSTADSRTPRGEAGLALAPVDGADPRAYQLGAPSADDAGPEFYLSSEEQSAEAPSEPQPGQVLGGHELLKVLGRGGMGVIYTARKDEQVVALKVLLGVNDPGVERRRQRFRREFEALRRLEHPNIVRVFDYGREGAFDWYTMEFVEGKDFERLLLEGTLEPDEKLSIFGDVCQALAHAHERSVVHRDVKPQNVLVDARGVGHVLDFGLAKILDQGVGMTRTGSSLGTPFYMAPEQLKSAKHIDARADVFALGVMLYEVVTGQRPFTGETAAEVGNNILTIDPPRPSKVKKGVSPDLDAICIKALEKDPERRYADAAALHEDVLRYKKGLGVTAREASSFVAEARRWALRNRAGLIGGLVASLLLVPVFVVLVVMRGGSGATTSTEQASATEQGDVDRPTETTPPVATAAKPPAVTEAKPPAVTEPKPPVATEAKPPPVTTEAKPPVATEPKPPVATEPKPPVATEAKPPSTTEPKPQSPVEVARAALVVPAEASGVCGADQADQAHTTTAARRALVLGLEAKVLAPMAVGELERALAGARALRATPGLQVTELVAEVERDVEALAALRALAGARLTDDPRLLRGSLELYGGERLRGAVAGAREGGWLDVGGGPVDPLALDLATLRALVVGRDAAHAGTSYALALLGLYRGLNERALDADFTAAGGDPAVQRRRRLAAWLEAARAEVWRALEEEAEAAWRDLTSGRKSDAQLLSALDDYVKAYGHTAAFRARREEWLGLVVPRRSWPDLVAGVQRRGQPQVQWKPLRGDGALDFEVSPLKDDRPFRVEVQSGALALENARASFALDDLVGDTAQVELATRGGLVAAFFAGFQQEVDPDAAWVVKLEGRVLGQDARRRPMTSPRTLIFDRNETDRVFRLNPQTISAPLTEVGRARPRDPALGAEAAGDVRVSEVLLTWRPDENQQASAQKLTRRLVERRLLERLVDETAKAGEVLAALDPARPTALLLDGAWAADRGALGGEQGASARLAAWADLGALRFKLAQDDGPGVRLTLRQPSAGSGAAWTLPNLLSPDPERFRDVVVRFDLRSKGAISVIVDGVRLANPDRNVPTQGAVFGLELVGRTRARIKDLELIQARPRQGLKP